MGVKNCFHIIYEHKNMQKLSVFRHIRKIAKSDYYRHHVCPSTHMEQLDSHPTDFHEIWYLSIFRKSVE
jgi:hypothetical protein